MHREQQVLCRVSARHEKFDPLPRRFVCLKIVKFPERVYACFPVVDAVLPPCRGLPCLVAACLSAEDLRLFYGGMDAAVVQGTKPREEEAERRRQEGWRLMSYAQCSIAT